MFDKPNQ